MDIDDPNSNATLIGIHKRIDSLEKSLDKPKSTFAKIKEYAAGIAIFVGISLSFISLYDILVSQPKEDENKSQQLFIDSINKIADLRKTMLEIQLKHSNSGAALGIISMLTPQILNYIQLAKGQLQEIRHLAGVPQLIVLAGEAMQVGDLESAKQFLREAELKDKSTPMLKAEIQRYIGKLKFMTGDTKGGRERFRRSLDETISLHSLGINGFRGFIVIDWLAFELAYGNCEAAKKRKQDFDRIIRMKDVLLSQRVMLTQNLNNRIAQFYHSGKTNCQVSQP